MGAAKKFKDNYPKERNAKEEVSRTIEQDRNDKSAIETYKSKIEVMLCEDPKAQKKAASIISALINSKN